MGIEPTYPAWKAEVLPLNYTCMALSMGLRLAGVTGFEPVECRSQSPVPYRLAIAHYKVGRGIRTLGLQSHNLAR